MMINQTVVGVHVVKLDSGINTEESLGSCLQRGSRPLHRYLQDKEKRSRAAVSDGKAHAASELLYSFFKKQHTSAQAQDVKNSEGIKMGSKLCSLVAPIFNLPLADRP